jgi:ring-1,2-phenylacetyl-CoA epoxidase subunit PaaE
VSPAAAVRGGEFHTLTVARVDRLTEDSVAVTFAVPDELRAAYAFSAGQSLPIRRTVGGIEQRRSYSICSAVGEAPRIGVREVPEGSFSRWLVREVRPGALIEVATPTGGLRADPAAGGRHLCIAAGSGITPLLSITASVLVNPEAQVTLIYGNRTTGSVMFAEELADLKNRYGPRFELVHVLSREPRDIELFTGRLDPDRLRRLLTTLVPLPAVDAVWLCGPFEMVTGAQDVLSELGVPREKVHRELFFVDTPPPPLRHPDAIVEGVTSEITVLLDGRATTAVASRTTTVLEAAQQTRTDLPFACKGGVCGTCRARVLGGEVEMVRNYALEPDEVAERFVLTCQSYPVTEQVTVDYDA